MTSTTTTTVQNLTVGQDATVTSTTYARYTGRILKIQPASTGRVWITMAKDTGDHVFLAETSTPADVTA